MASLKRFSVLICVAIMTFGSAVAHDDSEDLHFARTEVLQKLSEDANHHLMNAKDKRGYEDPVTARSLRHAQGRLAHDDGPDVVDRERRASREAHNAERMRRFADEFSKQHREGSRQRATPVMQEARLAQHSLAGGHSHQKDQHANVRHIAKEFAQNLHPVAHGPRVASNLQGASQAMKGGHTIGRESHRSAPQTVGAQTANAGPKKMVAAMRDVLASGSKGPLRPPASDEGGEE